MPKPERQLINMGEYLKSKGYEFSRIDDAGTHYVIDPNGDEVKFDAPGFLKSKGYDPKKFDVQFNAPDEALDISPISAVDRAKLALGNEKGSINYLKNKFDAVAVDPDQGLLVKNKGVWQKVDASGLGGGDAWEMSKELGKDILEGAVRYVPSIVGSTAGAAAGAAGGGVAGTAVPVVGNVAGAIAGGIAGAGAGGGAAEAFRTSMGRLAGTYDATPMEQLKDIGWESLLNMGGQAIGLGVKPGLAMLRSALKPLAESTAPLAKDALAQFWGLTTGAGAGRVRYALDAPESVVGKLARVQKSASAIDAENTLKEQAINEAKALMAPARKALSSKFGETQKEFIQNVPDSMEFQVGDMLRNSQLAMQDAGIGKLITSKNGKSTFQLFDQKTIEQNLAKGNIPDVIDTKSLNAIGEYVKEMNKFSNVPTLRGKTGAEAVMKIKRALSDSFYSITDDVAPNIKRAVAKFSSELNQNIGSAFDRSKVPGLAEKYSAMSNVYTKYSGAVNEAERMLGEVNGAEVFVNKLASSAGSNRTLKGVAADLAELMGPEAEQRIQSILASDAARGFISYMPNLGKLTTAGSAALGAAGMAAAGANPMVTGAIASQSSPRLVLKQIQYASKFKDLVSGMSPGAKAQFLRDPQVVQGTVRTLFDAYSNEEAEKDKLLKQSGVVP